MPAKKA
jgi:hypothetical protein